MLITFVILTCVLFVALIAMMVVFYRFFGKTIILKEKIVGIEAEKRVAENSAKSLEIIVEELKKENNIVFENIANKIIENQSNKLTEKNNEHISVLLNPLKDNIKEFKEKVETQQKENKQQYDIFGERIKNLAEQTQHISKEASDLANALKGQKKMQGDYGEQILEKILTDSGLLEGSDYVSQLNIGTESGVQRPDIVINLPNGHKLVIDSKLTLNSFVDYVNSEDENCKKMLLDEFIRAIRKNIDNLSKRDYEKNLKNSLDMVLVFFSIEAAYNLAIERDNGLIQYAYSRKILLISRTNLVIALKMVNDLWTREKQDKNIVKIIDGVQKLYDKFSSFAESFEKIGSQLDTAKKTFDKAEAQLISGRGSVIDRAKELNELGAKAKKKLPQALLDQADSIDFEETE
ncbi:MAG: DNA recombination protein RmuC [Bacteroidales bacterium]|nr:DNA recombination protein RmuC [Bacteroidales bacterium]